MSYKLASAPFEVGTILEHVSERGSIHTGAIHMVIAVVPPDLDRKQDGYSLISTSKGQYKIWPKFWERWRVI